MAWVILAIVAILGALLPVAYYKGRKDERQRSLSNTVDDLIKTKEKQEKREAAHDERVRVISSGPVDASDAERMLSQWSDKNIPSA